MVNKLAEDDSEEEFVDDMSYGDDDEFDAVDDGRDRERYSFEGPNTENEVMEEAPR